MGCRTTPRRGTSSNLRPPLLGKNQDNACFTGDIAELIIYSRALSTPERRTVLQYLGIKYLLPSMDPSGDGLTVAQDLTLGIDPLNSDVNGDGLLNGVDIALGFSPTNLYLNGDGYTNAQNIAMGIDPFTPYTPPSGPPPDNDGVPPTITLTTPPDAVLVP